MKVALLIFDIFSYIYDSAKKQWVLEHNKEQFLSAPGIANGSSSKSMSLAEVEEHGIVLAIQAAHQSKQHLLVKEQRQRSKGFGGIQTLTSTSLPALLSREDGERLGSFQTSMNQEQGSLASIDLEMNIDRNELPLVQSATASGELFLFGNSLF